MTTMEIKPLACPRCGADLRQEGHGRTYRCVNCGLSAAIDFSNTNESEELRSERFARDRAKAERDKARFERDRERAESAKARAPYEAEMQERQLRHDAEIEQMRIDAEREKRRNASKVGFASICLLLAMLVVISAFCAAPYVGAFFTGDVKVPGPSDDLKGKEYSEVVSRFEDAGFANIETIGLGDIDFVKGLYTSENSVDHVTVNGEADFEESAHFPKDAAVKIYYHSRPD